jgi:hypothetical protein
MSNRYAVLVALGLSATLSCGGSGGSTPTEPSTTSTSTDAEPTTADWAALAAELTANGVSALNEALTTSGVQVAAVPPPIVFAGLLQLQDERTIEVELHGLRFSGSYWCCGNLGPEPDSVISYQGEIRALITETGRVLRVTETLADSASFRWGPPSRARTIDLSPSGLQVVSDLAYGADGIEPRQEFRLVGSLSYLGGRGDLQHVEVDTALTHQSFFRGGSATVSGRMGSSSIPATPYTPGASQRCSLPREGCGPLANGNAPCTLYPACRR